MVRALGNGGGAETRLALAPHPASTRWKHLSAGSTDLPNGERALSKATMTRAGRQSRAASSFRLLATRDFGLLWLGETVSQIGDSLNRVALLWFAYETSHSTLRMSLVGVMQTLPP